MKRGYGWKKGKISKTDRWMPTVVRRAALPPVFDLRPQCPAVMDQGQLGSCVSNAVSALYQFTVMETKQPASRLSRLYIYYNGRVLENSVNDDSGLMVRDGLKAVATSGVCLESSWPYKISKFKTKPSQKCYDAGLKTKILDYVRVQQNLTALKTCLVENNPIVFGFQVPESFESQDLASTGLMKMPKAGEAILGGHCTMIVGYDDSKQCFIIQNSWGTGWGISGRYYCPYAFITDPKWCSDFWTLRSLQTLKLKSYKK